MRRGRHRKERAIGAGAALLASLCAIGVSGGVTASAQATVLLTWSSAQTVDPGGTPSAIACPSESLCVMVDRRGYVLQTLDPAAASPSWSSPAPIDAGHALTALACASEALCVAVDESGSELASTDPAGGSATWHAPRSIDGVALSAVSCSSTVFCVAVDRTGNALLSTDPNDPASKWTLTDVDGKNALRGVSCPGESLCLAVDEGGGAVASSAPASGVWRAQAIDLAGSPIAVSCASVSLCVAADSAGGVLASANAGAQSPTWSYTTADLTSTPTAVSCATSGLCVLLDAGGHAFSSDDPTAAIPEWSSSAAAPGATPTGLACLSSGLCVGIDEAGGSFTAVVGAPAVASKQATTIVATAATLTGTVDPHDAVLGECRFEYGPTVAYGDSAPCASLPAPTAGTQDVQANVAGLTPETTYHYRLLATNAGGVNTSNDQTFSTVAAVSVVHPHPSIAGVPGVGERLNCLPGISSEQAQTVTLAYTWVRDTQTIAHATGASYKVGSADATHHLQCRVTATNAAGSATTGSAFVSIPATGIIAAVGETQVGHVQAAPREIRIPVRCSTRAPAGCAIAVHARLWQASRAGRARRAHLLLGSAHAHLPQGQSRTIAIRLNRAGRRMLAHAHRLVLALSVRGTIVGTLQAELAQLKISLKISRRAQAAVASVPASPARTAQAGGRGAATLRSGLLAATPYMGWDTYFAFGPRYSESTVLEQASLLIDSGLAQDGYRYVWLDVGWWHGRRAPDGEIEVNRVQWPHGMRWLTETLHAAGLRAGLYTDAGREGCGGKNEGSYGHYRQDVNTFAAWGFDAVKVDFCGGVRQHLSPRLAYTAFQSAIGNDSPRRPMLLSICDFLEPDQYRGGPAFAGSAFSSYSFGPNVGNSWRTDTDVGSPGYVPFTSVLRNMDADATHPEAAGPGHWNDPDYLGPDQGMSEAQFRTQLGMWAMLAAPLMVSVDLERLSNASLRALSNREVVAIDQDPAGIQGTLLSSTNGGQVWAKPLSDGSRAVALLNRSASPLTISTTAAAVGMAPATSYSLRNLWTRETATTTGAIAATVPGDSTALLRVEGG